MLPDFAGNMGTSGTIFYGGITELLDLRNPVSLHSSSIRSSLMKFPKLFHLAATILCLDSTRAIAQPASSTYLSNVDTTDNGSYGISGSTWVAQPFRTGTSSGGYTLDAIDLPMAYGEAGVTNFRVIIYSNNNGRPGTALETLSGNTVPFTPGTYSYASSGITLSATTFYWIVAAADNTPSQNGFSGYYWDYTRDTVFNASDGWQIPFGNTHAYYNVSTGQWSIFSSSTYGTERFSVEATAAPEPDLFAFVTLGSAGFVLLRVVRSRKR
jgi:hypothetical protein